MLCFSRRILYAPFRKRKTKRETMFVWLRHCAGYRDFAPSRLWFLCKTYWREKTEKSYHSLGQSWTNSTTDHCKTYAVYRGPTCVVLVSSPMNKMMMLRLQWNKTSISKSRAHMQWRHPLETLIACVPTNTCVASAIASKKSLPHEIFEL